MTTIDQLNARGEGFLPGLIGIEFIALTDTGNACLLKFGRDCSRMSRGD